MLTTSKERIKLKLKRVTKAIEMLPDDVTIISLDISDYGHSLPNGPCIHVHLPSLQEFARDCQIALRSCRHSAWNRKWFTYIDGVEVFGLEDLSHLKDA